MRRQKNNDRLIQLHEPPPAPPCPDCHGSGFNGRCGNHPGQLCRHCDAVGFLNLDPLEPCRTGPGTTYRAARYAARYRAGLPIFSPDDCKTIENRQLTAAAAALGIETDFEDDPDD